MDYKMQNPFKDLVSDNVAVAEQLNPFADLVPTINANPFADLVPQEPTTKQSVWKEAPIKTIATFGKGLVGLPKQFASKLLMATQGIEGASVTDKGWGDRYIDLANKDAQKFVEEIGKKYDSSLMQEVAQLPQNLAYSLVSMGTGAAVGIPAGVYATPAVGYIAGAGASGVAAYRMTTYEIMQEFLELKDSEMIKKRGKGITAKEEFILKENFNKLAKKYGLWEAIPEAVSNLAFAGILFNPLTKIVGTTIAGKIITKVASLYGEELLTETITEMGQKKVRAEAGFPESEDIDWTSPSDWLESLKSIAPQTFLLTTVMGGAGGAIIKTSQAVKSLKQEIGEGHPLYKQFQEKLEEIKQPEEPVAEIEPVTTIPAEVKPTPQVKPTGIAKPQYGMSHRPTLEGMPPSHNLLEGETLPRDVYTHPEFSIASGRNFKTDVAAQESWSALQKIKNNPDADIMVYRASPKNELNIGDWITFSKDYAKQSAEKMEKVFAYKIKAKDAIFAGDDINEFGYYPKAKPTPTSISQEAIKAKAEGKKKLVGIKKRHAPQSIPEAIEQGDWRSVLSQSNMKYDEYVKKNYEPEELKKIQFLFSKDGKSPDIAAADLMIDYPEVGEITGYDIIRNALDQTGTKLTTMEAQELEYSKQLEEEYLENETDKQRAARKIAENKRIGEQEGIQRANKKAKVEKVKPKVQKEIAKPVKATPNQIKQAHVIASEKALISIKGKPKPGYRRIAMAMTGKKSIKDMTEAEARDFISSLKRLPKPAYRKGRLIPPSIPRTTSLVKQDFFRRRFRQPTPIRLFTSQNYYSEILGVKELTEPLELAKQRFDLEYRAVSRSIDEQGKMIDKISKTTMGEKIKSKIKNVPTKAIKEMRGLLNRHEEAPADLSPEKTKIFNWFRNFNRSILRGENAVREKLGIEPIKYRKAYVRHIADGMAKEMLMGKYPFPEGLKFWSEKIVGKKVFNPMEFQRELADDLEDFFSKDLIFATKSMLWTGLKEVHLSEPLRAFSEQLGALSKDLPIYEDFPIAQLQQIRQESIMPASTKKWLTDYVNTVIKGQQTQLDTEVNRIVTETGLGGLLNKVLKPFGRTLSQKPITNVFQKAGKAVIHGVMGWRPKQLIRNKFQLTQNLALYTLKANLKGFMPASVDKNLKELIDKSLFLKSYTGIEELPKNLQAKLEQLWLAPYQWTAVSNVGQSMKVAYWDTLDLITKSKYKNFDWADSKRTYKEEKGFLYASEKEKLLKEMEFGAGITQYSYIPMGMPEVFRHKALVPLTRLQSWWMNYFTKFTREAINRGFKGETSYGAKLPMGRRLGYFKYLLLGGALLTSMGYKRAFLLGVLPTYMSPSAQIAIGLYTYATANSDWERTKAKRRIYYSWRAFIPGSLAWKDFSNVWTGKKPLSSLFFYIKKKKKTTKWKPFEAK